MNLRTKLYIFIFSLIFGSNLYLYCQNISVNYSIETNIELEEIKGNKANPEVYENFKSSFQLINSMEAQLICSKEESKYNMSNVMPSDVKINHYEMAKIMAGHNDEFYTNILKGVSTKYFNAYGENFKIETLISDFEWKLLNETKMIGNLKCFKAISSYKVSNALIERVVKVEAWYSPKIQFSFGPKGYCGLPGLIIELKDDKFTYIVKDIKVIKEEFEFKKRPDGKLVTQEEIDALSEKAKKNYLDRKN